MNRSRLNIGWYPWTRSGVTLIELLVVIAVIGVLVAIVTPYLARSRGRAQALSDTARCDTIAKAIGAYANDWKDLPPVILGRDQSQRIVTDDGESLGEGNWFEHAWAYAIGLRDYIEVPSAFRSLGSLPPTRMVAGREFVTPHFSLTETLYADPAFFNWATQAGVDQFRPQPTHLVQRPDAKGMLWQSYTMRNGRELDPNSREPRAVSFFDGSSAMIDLSTLKPAMWNLYGTGRILVPTLDPRELRGAPVATTFEGVRGSDR